MFIFKRSEEKQKFTLLNSCGTNLTGQAFCFSEPAYRRQASAGNTKYFFYNGQKMPATIMRLNQKTATLRLDDGKEWLVTPEFLTKIIEQ